MRDETDRRRETVPAFPYIDRASSSPREFLAGVGEIFAVFDQRTQDSGNASYGVEVGGRRYFVKTAGDPDDDDSARLNHAERVGLLRNAAELARSVRHPALPKFHGVVESPRAPMPVYEWADGHLVRKALARVRALPASEVAGMLDTVFDLHAALAERGWVACDFYDGAMIYDFQRRRVRAVDLDCYRRGAFVNKMGRMFGSSRFMAPEEFELGAVIDERTTVFTLGRTAAVLLSDSSLNRAPFRGSDAQHEAMLTACRQSPDERFQSVAEFRAAWMLTLTGTGLQG